MSLAEASWQFGVVPLVVVKLIGLSNGPWCRLWLVVGRHWLLHADKNREIIK